MNHQPLLYSPKNAHASVWPTSNSGDEKDKTPARIKSIKYF